MLQSLRDEKEAKMLLNFSMKIAKSMLAYGAEVYRVEDTVNRIYRSFDNIKAANSLVTYNFVIVSFVYDDNTYTAMRRVVLGDRDLEKIALLNDISRRMVMGGCTLDYAFKKMKEIKEITDKQMKKIVVVKDFFQSEENKRDFKIVDELVYGFDLTLNFSKINEILENYSEDSNEEKTEVIKRAIDYYLRNIANNEKMTEDSIKYNIILENMYLKIMRMVASFDEKESEKFLNKLEKSKLYEVMRKLEE